MEVDKMVDKVADMVANMETDKRIKRGMQKKKKAISRQKNPSWWEGRKQGLVNWAQTFSTQSLGKPLSSWCYLYVGIARLGGGGSLF